MMERDNPAGELLSEDVCTLTPGPAQEGMRLDAFLAESCPSCTRSFLQKLVKEGRAQVNGKTVKPSFRVSPGEEITLAVPPPRPADILPEPIPLDILYEDEDLIFVNKPKGMVVHPAAGHPSGTLVNALLYHCQGSLSGIGGVLRPGIVHRIDQNTTGSLVACKNDAAHLKVAEQLKEHTITRKYRAIVHGRLEADGTVRASIGRHPIRRKEMAADVPGGKPAVTHYHVLEQFRDYTYIECQLETGRTHQIRVHMKSIGHPILGDEVYGPARCPVKGLQGQTLHAMTLGLIHPSAGTYIEVNAPLPEYFQSLLMRLPKA